MKKDLLKRMNVMLLTIVALMMSFVANAQWVAFDGSTTLDESGLGWTIRDVQTADFINEVVDDPDNQYNKFYNLGTTAASSNFQMWRTNGNYPNDGITLIMKLKAYDPSTGGLTYIESGLFGNNEKIYIDHVKIKAERGTSTQVNHSYDIDNQFGILRITYEKPVSPDTSAMTTIYFNEDPTPFIGPRYGRYDTTTVYENFISIGDGSGSKVWVATFDWIAIDTTGAYAPGEGTPLPDRILNPTSVSDDFGKVDVKVYPVPAKNELYVELPEKIDNGTCSIYNSTGQLISSNRLEMRKSMLNISSLPKGIYSIRIFSGNNKLDSKWFIKD